MGRLRFPRVQRTPGAVARARCIVMPPAMIVLLTVAAIRQNDSHGERFLTRAPIRTDHMFGQALRSMARWMRRDGVGEWVGVAIALVSSCLGGTAAAITRYLAGNTDPITLAILRWGIGFCCVLPAALLLKAR
jgi:hypothetical protein